MPARFRFQLRDGSTVTGVVQGAGGPCPDLHRLEVLRRKHLLGRLPRPAELSVYPNHTAEGDGPCVLVDLGEVVAVSLA